MSDECVVLNPYDGTVVHRQPWADEDDVEQALQRAHAAFIAWRSCSLETRMTVVRAGLARLEEFAEQAALDVTHQMGKPITEARGEFNTLRARAGQVLRDAPFALAADVFDDVPDITRRIEHHPLGVILEIGAWNYPLIIPINVILPSLLAGNTVVLKHSPLTPLTGSLLARAFGSLDVPHLVQDLVMTHDRARSVITDERIAHIAFTGSVEGGRAVQKVASDRFIGVGLELGGKDAAYVAGDADLERAGSGLVEGACYNAGQSCCAVERAYVHASVYDDFLAAARAVMTEIRSGDPMDESTTLGPLAMKATLDRLDQQVQDAVVRGARLLCGGRRGALRGSFYEPTLLADVPPEALVMQEESFGPMLPVARVSDDSVAVRCMNDSRYGLTASVWTSDADRAELLTSGLECGTIFQNRCDYIDPALPWTGWADSGRGSTLSRYGFHGLTRRRSVHLRK